VHWCGPKPTPPIPEPPGEGTEAPGGPGVGNSPQTAPGPKRGSKLSCFAYTGATLLSAASDFTVMGPALKAMGAGSRLLITAGAGTAIRRAGVGMAGAGLKNYYLRQEAWQTLKESGGAALGNLNYWGRWS
jgi:hypothetical protein